MWKAVLAAIITGAFVAACLPPFDLTFLMWLAMLPLLAGLWSVNGRFRRLKGFALGWLAGTVGFGIQLTWIGVVSPLGAVVLPLYLGCFWGLFGLFAATLGNPWREGRPATPGACLRTSFSLAAVFASLEWLRGWLFTGFGWNGLGVAFHDHLLMAQSADLLGVSGLSLFLVFFQASLLQSIRRCLATRHLPWDLGFTLLLTALLAGYGALRTAAEEQRPSILLKALLVQIQVPQDAARKTWSPVQIHVAYEEETRNALEALPPEQWPDWVIWPESALTGHLFRAEDGTWATTQDNWLTISQVREAGPFHLMYGINEVEATRENGHLVAQPQGRIFNSFALLGADDELQTFRKKHLVIFGETIPFVESIPLLRKIYEQQAGVRFSGSFSSGDSLEPLPTTVGDQPVGLIPSICFEDTVPRLERKFVRAGPQVIVNLTNDGWFKRSQAADQHFANARFRAIELRRPMLRCSNTGVTVALTSAGSTASPIDRESQILVDAEGSHFTRGTLLAHLPIPLEPSFSLYAAIGDWGIISLGLLGLLAACPWGRPRAAPFAR